MRTFMSKSRMLMKVSGVHSGKTILNLISPVLRDEFLTIFCSIPVLHQHLQHSIGVRRMSRLPVNTIPASGLTWVRNDAANTPLTI